MQDNNQDKSTDYTNKPSVEELKRDFTQAKPAHDTQIAKIAEWLDLINISGNEVVNTPKGKSKVQPKLCRKQAEWRYTVLSEPFLSTEDIFKLSPRGPLDRDAAYQNQLVLNYQFNEQMNKVKFIDGYVRSAVNEGTVIVKVCWRNETKMVTKRQYNFEYRDPTPDQLYLIQQGVQMYQQDPTKVSEMPPDMAESVMVTVESGVPSYAVVLSYEDVEVEENVVNQPDLELCDYRNVIIDPTCDGNIEDAQFVIYSYDTNMSNLRKASVYDNLDELEPENLSSYSDGDHENLGDNSFTFADASRKKFTVYEYWGYWDLDGSGETKPMVAAWVGSTMIRCEENPYPHKKIPFAVVSYLPVKNSVYGEPDAELIADNQRIIGALTRGMIDTFGSIAAGQKGTAKGALDFLNQQRFKAGQDFEFNPNASPDAAIWQAQYKELPASAYNMLQLQQNEASSITGIQPFDSGLSGNAYGSTAAGVNTAVSAQAKREFGILRRLTEGLKQIANMVMSMNGEWLDDSEIIRITDDQFVTIRRENLLGSFDIKLSISTQEMDNAKAQQLSFMLQTLGQTLPFKQTSLILEDIAKLNRMPELAQRIKDYQPQPSPEQQIQLTTLQVELEKKKIELAKIQSETALNTEKARKESSQADLNNLEYIHKEQGVDHARDMEKQQAQAEGNVKRDAFQAALKRNENIDTNEETR